MVAGWWIAYEGTYAADTPAWLVARPLSAYVVIGFEPANRGVHAGSKGDDGIADLDSELVVDVGEGRRA